jgi:hypothetical protein
METQTKLRVMNTQIQNDRCGINNSLSGVETQGIASPRYRNTGNEGKHTVFCGDRRGRRGGVSKRHELSQNISSSIMSPFQAFQGFTLFGLSFFSIIISSLRLYSIRICLNISTEIPKGCYFYSKNTNLIKRRRRDIIVIRAAEHIRLLLPVRAFISIESMRNILTNLRRRFIIKAKGLIQNQCETSARFWTARVHFSIDMYSLRENPAKKQFKPCCL